MRTVCSVTTAAVPAPTASVLEAREVAAIARGTLPSVSTTAPVSMEMTALLLLKAAAPTTHHQHMTLTLMIATPSATTKMTEITASPAALRHTVPATTGMAHIASAAGRTWLSATLSSPVFQRGNVTTLMRSAVSRSYQYLKATVHKLLAIIKEICFRTLSVSLLEADKSDKR